MKRMAILGTVAAMTAGSGALAQNSSYAHFGATSDTIRVNGNTVFPGLDWTYEMRIRVTPDSYTGLGLVVCEQQNAVEAKLVSISPTAVQSYMTRDVGCGTDTTTQFTPNTLDVWRHLAWVRAGSVIRLYMDGAVTSEWRTDQNCAGNHPLSTMSIGMTRMNVACCPSPAVPSFLGDLDWIRISAGARYTVDFTPPYECDVSSDASTQLLLKFNEPAGTATLVDESPNHFVCDVGVPVYPGVTATSPTLGNTTDGYPACAPNENSSYAHFGATSDTIRIQGNTVFPTVDFTYEMRVRMAKGAPFGHVISEQRDTYEAKLVRLTSTTFNGYMVRGQSCGSENQTPTSTSLSDDWHHIAWVRSGSTARLYLDGALNAEWPSQPDCLGNSPDSWMAIGMIRYTYQQPTLPSFLGDIDWIRVSSTPRYFDAFTPPFECEVATDSQTLLLLKFNEAAGTTTLIDESPSHFQCDVGVAVNPGGSATSPTLGTTADGYPACRPICESDIDENGATDANDIAILLANWSPHPKAAPRADVNGDGLVSSSDLTLVLMGWGTCP